MHFTALPDIFPMQTLEMQEGIFEERRKQAMAELEEIANRTEKPYEEVDKEGIKNIPAYQRRLMGLEL